MNDTDCTYKFIKPNVVEINWEFRSFRLDWDSLKHAIKNIENGRSQYATEKAWRDMLGVYQRAQDFLRQELQKQPIEIYIGGKA